MAAALRGSRTWLSRETETKHVITSALLEEVRAAGGMFARAASMRLARMLTEPSPCIHC